MGTSIVKVGCLLCGSVQDDAQCWEKLEKSLAAWIRVLAKLVAKLNRAGMQESKAGR